MFLNFTFKNKMFAAINPPNPSLPTGMDLWISYNHRNGNATRRSWRLLAITSILVQQFCYLGRQESRALQQETETRPNTT